MRRTAAKVAISVDSELLQRAEHLRASTGESRSALVSRALRRLLQAEARAQKVRDYVQAYERMPESAEEVRALRNVSRSSLRLVPWEES